MDVKGSGCRRGRVALRVALSISTILACGVALPAAAQLTPPPSVRQSVDANGVDLFLGTMNVSAPALSLGGDQGLSYYQSNHGSGFADNLTGVLNDGGGAATVTLGGVSDNFSVSGGTYTNTEGNGATLTLASNVYTYTRADGTVAHFDKTKSSGAPYYATGGRISDVISPSGATLSYNYASVTYCSSNKVGGSGYICLTHATTYRLFGVTSSFGYSINFTYLGDNTDFPGEEGEVPTSDVFQRWSTVTGVTGENRAVATSSSPSESFGPTTVGGVTSYVVTDPLGRQTSFRYASGTAAVAGITRPGSGSEDVTVAYTSGKVSSVTTAAGVTTYSYSDASGVRTVSVTDPQSHATVYAFDIASQRMTSVTDALSHTTSYTYDGSGRVTRVTAPEGNYVNTTYDSRGNITETRAVAKSGSGLSDIVSTASFDTTCSNVKTCNQPNSTTDARGHTTDYTYDSTHGGVLTVTAPAPGGSGTRPQTRYTYSALQAYYKNGGGSIVASGVTVYRVTAISQCQTGSSCSGTSDEVKTTVDYGPQTTGTGNNLLPVSVTNAAGDASLTATTALAYDDVGNLLTVDGPLSGSADTVRYRYDAGRREIGMVGPDPDGGGSLKPRATRITYDDRGRVTLVEDGNVNSQSDGDWSGFTATQAAAATYDAMDRKLTQSLKSGGTTYALTQFSYSGTRLQCTAIRMNSAVWGSLPSDACTLGTTGSYGPDRITKLTYDNTNRVTLTQTGYGTSVQADAATTTYTNNGQTATVTDGEGNKTSYAYDGLDRLSKTSYPNTTKGAGTSSSTDYEELIYDADSNVTSRRLRGYAGDSTKHVDYTYDHLNRVTAKDLPGSEPDVSYTYDLLDRMTGASQTGNALTFGFDALGRNTSQGGPQGTVSYLYDAAGNRTRMTWPDSFYVTYDHLVTGEVTAIRENGAGSGVGVLATFGYDNLGRRTTLTRGNGAVTTTTFDNVSRVASLALDLSGSSYDSTTSLAYAPSSQIASATRTNDNYAWNGHYNVNRSYTSNGLNQFTAAGATSLAYDARGNLTTSGSDSYGYSSENLLTSAPSSVTLSYDPGLRLYQTVGGSTTRFQYDGDQMIAEYNGSNVLQKRYVFGPGADAPLVEYAGSGTGSGVRTFLQGDERGSIVARSNESGAATAVESYDEYGIPASGNTGRFQYTGQEWLPEIGMYYFKARIYSPTLGRFLQTDPIGYEDGLNWYNYVHADPINGTDPSGLTDYTCSADGKCVDSNGNAVDPNTKLNNGDTVNVGNRTWNSDGQGGGYISVVMVVSGGNGSGGGNGGADSAGGGGGDSAGPCGPSGDEIVVCAKVVPVTVTITFKGTGDNLHAPWEVQFRVSDGSSGVLIQELDRGALTKKKGVIKFKKTWEAFLVNHGYATSTDTFDRMPGKGVLAFWGTATIRYYPGMSVPAGFHVGAGGNTGAAPWTTTDPGLPTVGVPTLERNFFFDWRH